MQTLTNVIITLVASIILSLIIGPYGGIVLLAVILGVVVTINQRNLEMMNDIKLIKTHLGVKIVNDFEMENEDIEKILQEETAYEESKIDEEIERELEEEYENNKVRNKNKSDDL